MPDASGTVLLNTGDQSITGDLTLTSTDGGSADDPSLILYRNSSSPAYNDTLGEIIFRGNNATGGQTADYASITTKVLGTTNNLEHGELNINVLRTGSSIEVASFSFSEVRFKQPVKLDEDVNITFEGSSSNDHETTLTVADPTGDNTITLPDASGTVALQEQAYQSINAQTGTTYTTVLADGGKLVTLSNASAITLTIPPNSSVAYSVGTKLDFIQIGAGQVTVAGGTGVTVNSTPTLKTRTQHSGASCIKIATDTWQLVGDLAES